MKLSRKDCDCQERYEEALKNIQKVEHEGEVFWETYSGFGSYIDSTGYIHFLPGYLYTDYTKRGLLLILNNEFEFDKHLVGY